MGASESRPVELRPATQWPRTGSRPSAADRSTVSSKVPPGRTAPANGLVVCYVRHRAALFVGNRRLFGVIDEALRAKREAVCFQHMTDENAHVFDQAIAAFA